MIIWTGFAMSPAIVSVFPVFVTLLGGQQTAGEGLGDGEGLAAPGQRVEYVSWRRHGF